MNSGCMRRLKAIPRWRHGDGALVFWRVRIVATCAAIPLTWTPREVPVAGHAAMGAMLIRTILRTVTLGAQPYHIDEFNGAVIG